VTPSTTEKPTQPPPPIVWRKGKNGKDIHYDPAKDRVIASFSSHLLFLMLNNSIRLTFYFC
jgi:hypothetical protein